jgi:hypothetical protein
MYLEKESIPYVFTAVQAPLYRTMLSRDYDSSIKSFISICKDINWAFIDVGPEETNIPMGFYDWAVATKQKMGVAFHPLEHAHQEAFELLRNKLDAILN